ncbi:MAG: 3'-5' exonuclease, partial [Candidatus Pacebacteria bacterium]|nr:3'-5' exonuclease [Candidatus Paceibacterota bacterium]
LDAVSRGSAVRTKINITMCSRKCRSKERKVLKNYLASHLLMVETSNEEIIEKLRKRGYKLTDAKKGKRIRISSFNLRELIKTAKELQVITDGIIEVRFKAGIGYDTKNKKRQNSYAVMMPAKNLMIGHKIPIRRGNDIVYDEIIDIQKKEKDLVVYDLEVEKVHNFLANNVVVHNSIFSFQGASFNNVLKFKSDFPDSKNIVLGDNYRSTQDILDLAYNFIQLNNPNRLEYELNESAAIKKDAESKGVNVKNFEKISKKLRSNTKEDGGVNLLSYETAEEEVLGVIDKIWEIKEIDKEAHFSDFCVLVRANDSANYFIRGFERASIPYYFMSSKGLYSHPIILDIIAYFKIVLNFYDSPSFYRVLRSLPVNFTSEEVAKIGWFADENSISLFEALKNPKLLLGKESKEKIKKLLDSLEEHFKLSKEKNVSEIFVRMINDLHYAEKLKEPTEENLKNWEIIYQFYQKTKNFENTNHDGKLIAFMDQLEMELESGDEGDLSTQIDESDSVKIMTVHSAKGLEFKYVFVVSLVHRKFPSDKRSDPIKLPKDLIREVLPEGDFHIEEERRLFYVALTRAKRGLFLTWANDYGGKQLKKPSRFLIESRLIDKASADKQKMTKGAFCFTKQFNGFKKESNETTSIRYDKLLPSHFSFSQLAAFESCPLQYKYAHILKIPTKGKPNFSFGKTIHNTLCRFVNLDVQVFQSEQKHLFRKDEKERNKSGLSLDDLLKMYQEEWIDAWFNGGDHKEEYREKGKVILTNFYKDFINRDSAVLFMKNEPALEKTFSINLNGHKFVGAIDRIDVIDNKIEIIDYKTGVAKKTLATSDKFQLEIYNLAAHKVFDLKPQKLTYYYIEQGTYCSFEPKEKSVEKTEEKILNIIEKIKRSKFKPTAGWQCQYCDYKNICPHRKF